ncbi:MAG TPA: hypothetical protein VHC22_01780 [Pirellulales bacterium]|nr:hypothetical protein [Pirellulales bacterium]
MTRSESLALADAALDAFWRVVASRFPEATTGDLSPHTTVRLAAIAEDAIKEWISANVPEAPRKRELAASGDIDVHELLKTHQQVAVIWGIEDVQAVRPDLTDDQSWEVLTECRRKHDCEVGFNWLLIETIADHLFPEPETTEE